MAEDMFVCVFTNQKAFSDLNKDCHVVAVHPEFQKQGIGKLLTKWGIEVARQMKAPLYLESSAAASKMYQDLGFRCLESGVHLGSDVVGEGEDSMEVPVMIKSPS